MTPRKPKRLKALWFQSLQKLVDETYESAPPLKRKPVRAQSRTRAAQMRKYRAARARFFVQYPWCQCCSLIAPHSQGLLDGIRIEPHPATEIHHTRGRTGTLLLDERFWEGTCRWAHIWIGAHPAKARELGLLCAKGDWNKVL